MTTEVQQLKKQVNQLRYFVLCISALLLFFLFAAFKEQQNRFDIIRAKGIIIEDSLGNDRILLGAPIPASKQRVRTDTALVRKHWAKNFPDPDQYMKWYNNYYHGAVGMVVLNEQGFDRLAIGEKLPDPNMGKRMFEASGMIWNDDKGSELGGAGTNKGKDGRFRSVVGVDDPEGEAVHLVALEDGTKGLMIAGADGRLMLGMSKKDGRWFANKESFGGIKYFDTAGKLKWEQKMN